jgi:tRNA:m4X modification enzyme
LFILRALGFSESESEEIGRRSKRLIDAGRVWYLKQFGMDASLYYYVDPSVSLENVALIAWNNGGKIRKKGRNLLYILY